MADSPRTRKRTANQAIQGDVLALGMAQKGVQQARRQGQKQISSYKGATRTAIGAVRAQNLGGLRGTPEGRQLQQEYAGRIHSLQSSLPFGLAPLQADMKGNVMSAQSDVAKAQLALQQDQQDRAMAIQDAIKTQQQNQTQKRQGAQAAYSEAMQLIREQSHIIDTVKAKQARGETLTSSEKHVLSTHAYPVSDLEWQQFESALAGKEGIDPRSARKAVNHLQQVLAAGATGPGPHGHR